MLSSQVNPTVSSEPILYDNPGGRLPDSVSNVPMVPARERSASPSRLGDGCSLKKGQSNGDCKKVLHVIAMDVDVTGKKEVVTTVKKLKESYASKVTTSSAHTQGSGWVASIVDEDATILKDDVTMDKSGMIPSIFYAYCNNCASP
ncbi:hypothetical protein V6N13_042896 [Hibiscus sabdariffa]|uniref:Uncharacterized protein n=1 Tax=Hibiscus sabdariffa TaxID=183260 RepID=A0ABR2G396_9ROSI